MASQQKIPGSAFKNLEQHYANVWHAMPFTSFVIYDEILKRKYYSNADSRWTCFLRDLKKKGDNIKGDGLYRVGVTDKNIDTMTIDQSLWRINHGLCTSFAIRVAHEAGLEEFIKYGNNGVHRLAWVISEKKATAMLIDSSARQAVWFDDFSQKTVLRAEKNKRLVGQFRERKFVYCGEPEKIFEPLGGDWQEALRACLKQLLGHNEIILLFRQSVPKLGFNGRIRWSFSEQFCEWSSPGEPIYCAFFGALNATKDDEADCSLQFDRWIGMEECRRRQFSGVVGDVVDQIWLAALQEWGLPRLSTEN